MNLDRSHMKDEANQMAHLKRVRVARTFKAEFKAKSARQSKSQSSQKSSKRCPTGKTRYRDHREAEYALHRIEVKRQWFALDGIQCRRLESRIYFHRECKGFHLTSKNRDDGGSYSTTIQAA